MPRAGHGGPARARWGRADALLVTDDGIRFWADGSWAIDRDLPLLVVNHASAEEWGMRSLATYLAAHFPGLPIHHLPQGCLTAPSLAGRSASACRGKRPHEARQRTGEVYQRSPRRPVRLASPDCLPLPIE